ncbi:hypothetical protein SI65_09359 [Aspergillus cristatus]|uniref:MGS207 protein n=1 Tax=Aspergillus cristatus TaxID=573508 RepID=A0A1E3B2E1_ASPCR|nr:hypothetical protein SI65_09359 [Aspergillus cristatus]
MLQFSFSLPRIYPLWERSQFKIPPPKIYELENAPEKPTRALKYLIKLNHANHAILFHERKSHNHIPHLLSSAWVQGADADELHRLYETECLVMEPWVDSPGEVSLDDWRDFLGRREYQRAFVNYFEDELVRHGYDWKEVVNEYLFSGEQPLFNSLITDLGHPLIHLSYAFEFSSRELAMEALGLAATTYSPIHKYLSDPIYTQTESSYHTPSLFDILSRVRTDIRFRGLFGTPGNENIEKIFATREDALIDHWNAWKIEGDAVTRFRETQEVATALLLGTHADGSEEYDFFFLHVLSTSHAVRILLPLIPAKFQLALVRQWWLLTLSVYIAQLRPEIHIDRIRDVELKDRDWKWVAGMALKGEKKDAHYVKVLRVLREAAGTWGDEEGYYLRAAVRFAEEFIGWGGFV